MKRLLVKTITLFYFCLSIICFGQTTQNQTVKGIYSFAYGPNFPKSASLTLPYISGMTAYWGWRDIEPTEQNFHFSNIDSLLDWAALNKKVINVGYFLGDFTPEWAIARGIKVINWTKNYTEDEQRYFKKPTEPQRSPIPWDSVYLNLWKKAVVQIANRYKNHPGLGAVAISGPTMRDLSCGLQITKPLEWEEFKQNGYSPEILFQAWKMMIEFYVNQFQGHPLYLVIGPEKPATNDVTLATKIINYLIEKNYPNITVQCVFLNDTWFLTGGAAVKIRALLRRYYEAGHPISFQMAQSAQRNDTWKGKKIVQSLNACLNIGIESNASWIEVWHDDIIMRSDRKTPNTNYQTTIQEAANKLK
ncbi:MAG: beta-galactosidase [Bacteroidia bacterium]|nr:beta-galactosidase [Bacteroidia bacterium]